MPDKAVVINTTEEWTMRKTTKSPGEKIVKALWVGL